MANINQRYFLMKISTLNKQKGKVFFCCAPVASLLPDHLQPSSLVTVAASIKSPNQFDKSLISGAVSHCYKFIGLEPISPRLPPPRTDKVDHINRCRAAPLLTWGHN